MPVVFCNNEIEKVIYSGYTIEKIYACDGELVYESSPQPQSDYKAKVVANDDVWGVVTAQKDCNSSSAVSSSETSSWVARTEQGNIPIDILDVTSLWIGDCVTEIGSNAFSGYTALETISALGGNVTLINTNAFKGCSALTNVYFGCNLQIISNYAFSGCTSLSAVSFCLPISNLTTIGTSAFKNCTSLTSVTLPNTVTSMGATVFYGCTNLKRLVMTATTPPTLPNNSMAFDNVAEDFEIIVPVNSYNAYRTAVGWSTYGDKIHT